jgi:hypothetical protein
MLVWANLGCALVGPVLLAEAVLHGRGSGRGICWIGV